MGRVVLLIVGFVVALGLMGASQPQSAGQAEKGEARPSVEQSLEAIAAAATKTVNPVKPTEYERPCDPSQDRRGSDLCAQWKAADGTVEGAVWAKWQTILSTIGVAGLIYSLHLTRKAVKAATDASEDAEAALAIAARNADAATQQVEIAQEATERQLRAYVSVSDFYITDLRPGAVPELHFTVKNAGQTPAKQMIIRAIGFMDPEPRTCRVEIGGHNRSSAEFGPGHSAETDVLLTRGTLNDQEFHSFVAGKFGFVVAGYIIYRDVFNRTRRIVFRAISPNEGMKNGRLKMYRVKVRST